MHKLLALGLAAALAGCGQGEPAPTASAAQQRAEQGPGVRDPLAFVQATYARYARASGGAAPEIPAGIYSPALTAALAGRTEPLGFDPWVNGQDWDVQGLIIQEAPPPAPDRRIVAARFRNAGQTEAIRFVFVPAGRRWQIDDILRDPQEGSAGWRLRAVLEGEGPGQPEASGP